jgi:hypothetical protein
MRQRFEIGTQYQTRHKHPKVCTIIDVLKTYNSKNELVKIRYVSTHEFMGQIITDNDVLDTTIALGIEELKKARGES